MRRDDPDAMLLATGAVASHHRHLNADKLIELLRPRVTEKRWQRMCRVAQARVTSVHVVLDCLSDPHNVAAVLRSCDAFGVQNVHLVRSEHPYKIAKSVARKSEQWLTLQLHDDMRTCQTRLREEKLDLYVATIDGELSVDELRRIPRVAVALGHERRGPSSELLAGAAGTFRIPMEGFVESLNVSVAAAVALYALTQGRHGTSSEADVKRILAQFLSQSLPPAASAPAPELPS